MVELDLNRVLLHFQKILGFSFYSVFPKFSKNTRFDFSRFCDFSKKYSVRFGRFCAFSEKMVGFLMVGFTVFLEKYSVLDTRFSNRQFSKNGRFFENRVKNREPRTEEEKKNLCPKSKIFACVKWGFTFLGRRTIIEVFYFSLAFEGRF